MIAEQRFRLFPSRNETVATPSALFNSRLFSPRHRHRIEHRVRSGKLLGKALSKSRAVQRSRSLNSGLDYFQSSSARSLQKPKDRCAGLFNSHRSWPAHHPSR
ncbi:hypothetical protein GALMADRAFT_776424 [Galerina marginata CBS 339.88]|uniref:Uncharacterized protein n=1 Tax=Galerina marginata (strain CBS 339.88) TaxID=685588 RepID=A0A067SNU0_GALM3|nr:hypothetical protein GALMADRAFT_776424 [Galerina marginata CBS 339.88]